VRYGGQLATNLYYRVYVKYFNRDGLVTSAGNDAPDNWNAIRGGCRMDWEPSAENHFTLQGDYYNSDAGKNVELPSLPPASLQSANVVEHNNGGNVLGRWTHAFSDTSQLALQAYYDHARQDDGLGTEDYDTYDLDLQHQIALGTRNDIVWGAGYRYTEINNTPSFNLPGTPESHQLQLFNAFAQDDITLVRDRLHFILGSKLEHNDLTGFEFEPSARLLWTPTRRQTVWAAVSRAVRTPSLVDRNGGGNAAPPPGVSVSQFGNPNAQAENVIAYELGYRIEPLKQLSFDLSAYYNVYDNLLAFQNNPPGFQPGQPPPSISQTLQNNEHGETYGAELSAQWQVTEHWKLVGSYTWLHMHLTPDPSAEMDSPQQQFQIRSYLDLPHHIELNGAVYYVDQINPLSGATRVSVPAYVRLDFGVAWHPVKSLEIGIWGQNLLDGRHAEFTSPLSTLQTEVPRSVMGRVTWRF
jgi:iron complex outermembrane receptor protein